MNTIKRILPFLTLTLLFAVTLAVLLCMFDKGESHLMLNTFHAPWLDYTMRGFTILAEYGIYVAIVVLLFRRAGFSAIMAASSLLSTLIAQVLKHILVAPRPALWFSENMPDVELTLVEGVKMNYLFSFPSGHTTAAFTFAMAMVYVVENSPLLTDKKQARVAWQCLLFLLAALCGYSRIYMSQHFASDVLAGCLIGTCSSLLVCLLTDRLRLTSQPWWHWRISFPHRQS